MNKVKNIILAVVFLLVVWVIPSVQSQMFFFPNPMLGEEAPDFTLNTIKQDNVNYKSLVDGKDSILFFWATWCPHCRTQIIDLNKNQSGFEEKNVEVLLIDVGEDKETVQRYADRNGIDMDIFLDETGELSNIYPVVGFPTFFFVGKDGVVKDIQHQLPDDYYEIFEE